MKGSIIIMEVSVLWCQYYGVDIMKVSILWRCAYYGVYFTNVPNVQNPVCRIYHN